MHSQGHYFLASVKRKRHCQNVVAFLLFPIFLFAGMVHSQVVIAPLWQDRGIMLRDNLWNVSILSSQPLAYNSKIEITMVDASTGLQLFSGISKTFLINGGNNILTSQVVTPVMYTPLSTNYQFNPTTNSLLPPGIYNICYRLYKLVSDAKELVGEGCFNLESDPLSPPTLIMPETNAELNTSRPFFTWLPPVPNQSLPLLNYTFKLSEKLPDQSPQEAIERNLPIYNKSNIRQATTVYPGNLPALDTAKVYVWQIIAYNDRSYVAASECWPFTIKSMLTPLLPIPKGYYVPLVNSGSAQVIKTDRVVRISYNNESADTALICPINLKGQKSHSEDHQQVFNFRLKPGLNNIVIDLESLEFVSNGKTYELSLVNARNERWWIYFQRVSNN